MFLTTSQHNRYRVKLCGWPDQFIYLFFFFLLNYLSLNETTEASVWKCGRKCILHVIDFEKIYIYLYWIPIYYIDGWNEVYIHDKLIASQYRIQLNIFSPTNRLIYILYLNRYRIHILVLLLLSSIKASWGARELL